MKSLIPLAALVVVATFCVAQVSPAPKSTGPAEKLSTTVYDWENMIPETNPRGARRMVFDGPTATVDRMHVHVTTLNPGEKSGEPSKRLEEEIVIVKEGLVEANWDGKAKAAGPGSVFFFASGSTTFLRNAGSTPCTYFLIYYYTPLTPKK